jgi:hypothetical protein
MKTVNCTSALLVTAMMLTPTASAADSLGILFTTPGQRAALDAGGGDASATARTDNDKTTGSGPSTITLNGTLISSMGKKEVWLNGEPSFAGHPKSAKNLKILPRNRVKIRPEPTSGAHVLKPGQVVNLGNGQVVETYNYLSSQETAENR